MKHVRVFGVLLLLFLSLAAAPHASASQQTDAASPRSGMLSAFDPSTGASSDASPVDVIGQGPFSRPASLSSGPVGQTGTWTLIFDDEFSSSSLNTNKWVTCYWWGGTGCTITGDGELEWYLASQVTAPSGHLRLRAQKKTVNGGGTTYNYVSGMVSSGDSPTKPVRFAFKYGYVEMRAKVPAGQGLWPALWMWSTNHSSYTEIDLMELLGGSPTTMYMHYHYVDSSGVLQGPGAAYTGPNFSSGYHVFGVDWQPSAITWYVDGVKRWSFTNTTYISSEYMYLIMNLAVGGYWGGPPNSSTVFPADFLIDYVRVWK